MASSLINPQWLSKIGDLIKIGGRTAVGVSVGSSSVKIVELKKIGKTWKLLHFGIVQLPEDAIVNREIVNQIAVTENIKTLVSQLKLQNHSVCSGFSGTSLIIKKMSLEVANLKELEDEVFWEAEQYLPFDAADVAMDFQMISRSKDNKTDVILVAVKKSALEGYMSCLSDSGLRPKIVDVDFFALQNAFEANYPTNPSESVAIVDLGASALKFVIVHAGVPVFTKDSALGGRTLTSEIQKNLNLSFSDSETLKLGGGPGGTMPQEVSELMHLMGENFAIEIKKSLDFYNASSSGAPVAYVLLTGGSAKIPGLSKVVEDITGLPTQILNPFNAITYEPALFTPSYLESIGPIAAVPIGLAIRAAGGT